MDYTDYETNYEFLEQYVLNNSDYADYMINITLPRIYPDKHDYLILSLYFIIFVCALFGNVLVCLAVMTNRDMRSSVTNIYIVNLAIADVLVSLLCLPVNAINGVSTAWYFGDVGCKLLQTFPLITLCVSIFTLTMIAVDRYLAICWPLEFQISRRRVGIIILIIWILSTLLALPVTWVAKVERNAVMVVLGHSNWLASCLEGWDGSVFQKVFYVLLSLVCYVLPLTIIGAAYTMVCIRLWSGIPGTNETGHGQAKKRLMKSNHSATSSGAAQEESRRKVARMLIVVVIIFAICLLPLQVVNLMKVFGLFESVNEYLDKDSNDTPFLVANLIAYINSAVNPIIYNFMSAKFRKAFHNMFFHCGRQNTPRQLNSQSQYSMNKRSFNNTSGVAPTSLQTTEYVPMTAVKNNNYHAPS